MTKSSKWVLIEAGHDEDEHDISVGILKVLDSEEDAKKALKEQLSDWKQRWGYDDDDDCIHVPDDDDEDEDVDDDDYGEDDNISWNDDETEVTITSGDYCSDWCKVYKIEEI